MVQKIVENAHKIAYLSNCYPQHTIGDIIAVLQMPAIDINAAIWYAKSANLIEVPEDKPVIAHLPEEFDLGEDIRSLEQLIAYTFTCLNREEQDMEEFSFNQWTQGYPAHNVLVAIEHLLKTQVLAQYTLTDKEPDGQESPYTFFTLYENREKEWGRKQFKSDTTVNKPNGPTVH